MKLTLGPMPERLRKLVHFWIEKARCFHPEWIEEKINALSITGGPGGCRYLDAEGEVWDWTYPDEDFTRVEDGPDKVGTIAVAADYRPELRQWLPRRPPQAVDCRQCGGGGWLLPQGARWLCLQCHGMGWLAE